MEEPITTSDKKILKVGRNIKFNPKILNGLKGMNIDAFSLANNHIMDYGVEGYEDTLKSNVGQSNQRNFLMLEVYLNDLKVIMLEQ